MRTRHGWRLRELSLRNTCVAAITSALNALLATDVGIRADGVV